MTRFKHSIFNRRTLLAAGLVLLIGVAESVAGKKSTRT